MGVFVIIIIFIVISALSSSAKKTPPNTNRPNQSAPQQRPPQQPPRPVPEQIPEGESKWGYDDEYYGEGIPPVKNRTHPQTQSSRNPHTPKAHVSVPEPKRQIREAPIATVKTSLRTMAERNEEGEATAPATIQIAGEELSFSGDNALKAVLYAEVLGRPKGLR